MREALERLCERAEAAVHGRYNIIILSDRMVGPDRIPIPALLATAAVHHHLIRKGLRTSVGLVVETGEAREVHHFPASPATAPRRSTLISPSRRWRRWPRICRRRSSAYEVVKRYIKSVDKGILKVMSKMGISTYQSYCGAQIFDAVGLFKAFVDAYFSGTATTIEGAGLAEIARETARRHGDAFGDVAGAAHFARGRRRIRLSPARRSAQLDAGDGVAAAARGARQGRDKYRPTRGAQRPDRARC